MLQASSWQFTSGLPNLMHYRKVPKFLDARKLCCNLHKIQARRPNYKVFYQNDANGIANSKDTDETEEQSDMGLHCLPRPIRPKT